MRRYLILRTGAAVALALGLAASPALGAGFGIFEQGSKAMGMAGAFTAQADDPSAMFHNLGGLGFFKERMFSAGVTWITPTKADFQGANPFPGQGVTAQMADLNFFPPHAYYIQPINDQWTFGLGLNAPFGLSTEWDDKDTFPGRFISLRAELQAVDLNPALGWQVTDNFGIGFGVIGRFSDVSLLRRVQFPVPPFPQPFEVASLELESDLNEGFGWNVGFLHKVNNSFSWGFSYRSEVTVDYTGEGVFTQISTGIPPVDAGVAAVIPFGQQLNVETGIDFPAMASLGLAFALGPDTLLETDLNWTGWSSFDALTIDFTSAPLFSSTIPQNYDDAYNYRVGLRHTTASNSQWRFGIVFDETPQPESSVGPLLPDADRIGYTVGWGSSGGLFDIAFMYLDFDTRTTTNNRDGFFGTYENTVYLLGLTVNF